MAAVAAVWLSGGFLAGHDDGWAQKEGRRVRGTQGRRAEWAEEAEEDGAHGGALW